MNPEYPSKEEIDEARSKSISKSIRLVGAEELSSLGDRLFKASDPWHDKFTHFIAENAGARFYHAKASHSLEIVYCHPNNKGIWFFEEMGKGPIQPKDLELIRKIVEGL